MFTLFRKWNNLRSASIKIIKVHHFHRVRPSAGRWYIFFTIKVSKKITVILSSRQGLHDDFSRKTLRNIRLMPESQLGQNLPLDGLQPQVVRLLLPVVLVDAVGARGALLGGAVLQLGHVDVVVVAVAHPLAAHQGDAQQHEGPPGAHRGIPVISCRASSASHSALLHRAGISDDGCEETSRGKGAPRGWRPQGITGDTHDKLGEASRCTFVSGGVPIATDDWIGHYFDESATTCLECRGGRRGLSKMHTHRILTPWRDKGWDWSDLLKMEGIQHTY